MLVCVPHTCAEDGYQRVRVGNLGAPSPSTADGGCAIGTHLEACLKLGLQLRDRVDLHVNICSTVANELGHSHSITCLNIRTVGFGLGN